MKMGLLLAMVLGQHIKNWSVVKVDSDQAIQLATNAAARVGLQNLEVSYFALVDQGEPYWGISLAKKGQKRAICNTRINSQTGHLLWFESGVIDQKSTYTEVIGRVNPDRAKATKLAWKIVRNLASNKNLRLNHVSPAKPQGDAAFEILVDGKRYLNFNPSIGYSVTFDLASEKVVLFTANESLPAIEPKSKAVNAERAKKQAEQWIQKQPEFARCKEPNGPLGPPMLKTTLEPGYFKFGDSPIAKRVWLATTDVFRTDSKTPPVRFNSFHCLVDQASGEVKPYKDRDSVMQ